MEWWSLATGAAFVALAVALLALNFHHRANRVFAALLALRGVNFVVQPGGALALDARTADLAVRVAPYFFLPLAFLSLWFLAVYPVRRWLFRRRGATLVAFLLPILVLETWYVVDHDAWARWLYPVAALWVPAYALVAWVLVRDHARAAPSARSASPLLVAAGFSIIAVAAVVGAFAGMEASTVSSNGPSLVLGAAVLGATALAATRAAARAATARERRPYLVFLAGAVGFPALSAAAVVHLAPSAAPALVATWRLALPLLVVHGLLRHQMFGIDLKVKWTIHRGTLAAVFLAVFFVAAQLAQNFLSEAYGWALGGVAAGVLLFAIAPLQSFAARVAEAALPGVQPPERMSDGEREAVYADLLRSAWADGALTADERRLLEAARQRLGLSVEAAHRLEGDVHASAGPT